MPLNIQVDGNKYNWDNLEHFYKNRDDEDFLELARVYDTVSFLDINVEVLDNNLEDNTEQIEELYIDTHKILSYDREESKGATVTCFKLIIDEINRLKVAIDQLRKDKSND